MNHNAQVGEQTKHGDEDHCEACLYTHRTYTGGCLCRFAPRVSRVIERKAVWSSQPTRRAPQYQLMRRRLVACYKENHERLKAHNPAKPRNRHTLFLFPSRAQTPHCSRSHHHQRRKVGWAKSETEANLEEEITIHRAGPASLFSPTVFSCFLLLSELCVKCRLLPAIPDNTRCPLANFSHNHCAQ